MTTSENEAPNPSKPLTRSRLLIGGFVLLIFLELLRCLFSTGPMPEDTHFMVSTFSGPVEKMDITKQIYSFIRTPAYSLLSPVFQIPMLNVAAAWLMPIGITCLLFWSLLRLGFRKDASFIVAILFLPGTIIALRWLTGITTTFISPNGLYDYEHMKFSVRWLFAFFSLLAIYFYLKRRQLPFLLCVLFSFWSHPTSGILLCGQFGVAEVVAILCSSGLTWLERFKKAAAIGLCLAIVTILGVAPQLWKMRTFAAANPIESVSTGVWYENEFRDEASDFSPIYGMFTQRTAFRDYTILAVFVLAAGIFLYRNNEKIRLLALFVYPFVLYLFLVALEYLSFKMKVFAFLGPIISLQPGYKLLCYGFWPSAIICAGALSFALGSLRIPQRNIATAAAILLVLGINCLGLFKSIRSNPGNKGINYARLAVANGWKQVTGYDAYLRMHASLLKNPPNPSLRPMVTAPDADVQKLVEEKDTLGLAKGILLTRKKVKPVDPQEYQNKFGRAEVFFDLLDMVRTNVPTDSGLIIPPYLWKIRESLPNYDVFYQEHHDGNLAMGAAKFYTVFSNHRQALLGLDWKDLPPSDTELHNKIMRDAYLQVDIAKLTQLKKAHPGYEYLITESTAELPLQVVAANDAYKIYSLSDL